MQEKKEWQRKIEEARQLAEESHIINAAIENLLTDWPSEEEMDRVAQFRADLEWIESVDGSPDWELMERIAQHRADLEYIENNGNITDDEFERAAQHAANLAAIEG